MPLNDKDTSYASLTQVAKLYADMYGDKAFVKSGNTYTSTINMNEDGVNLTMKTVLTASGEDIVGMKMDMNMKASDDQSTAMAMKMSMEISSTKAVMSLDMDLAGMMTMTMALNMTSNTTAEKPVTTLPTGATVVDLLGASAIPEA